MQDSLELWKDATYQSGCTQLPAELDTKEILPPVVKPVLISLSAQERSQGGGGSRCPKTPQIFQQHYYVLRCHVNGMHCTCSSQWLQAH